MAGVIGIDDIRNSLERQFKMLGTYYLEPGESMSFEAKGLVYIYNSYQSAEWYVLWVDNGAATIIKGISGIPFKATYSGGKVILENNMSNTRKYVIACQNLNLVE